MKINGVYILFLLAVIILDGCSESAFIQQADGIVIELPETTQTDARILKIQVCDEDIIRVVAAPADTFSTRESLMVDQTDWKQVPWSVRVEGGEIVLATAKLTVIINRTNGAVTFFDADGLVLLKEKPENGKIISPAEVMEEKTYHIRQMFLSPDDEAFYGLGQHQNNIMNYKGHDVDLWQYNTVAVVPFLVSSNNYGILWDNNSQTKFGDIRDYGSLSSSLILTNKDGNRGGLTAEYFRDGDFQDLFTMRTESAIEYDFEGDFQSKAPEGYSGDRGGMRWSGEIECREPGRHKFRLYSSGYIKMWLDGEPVVDAWRQNWLPWTHLLTLDMEEGKRYPIQIELSGSTYIGLRCLSPEPEENANTLSLYSEVADQIDYYFISGDNLDQVVQGYREVTGKAPMMPKWAMGFWQCRQRYTSQEELLEVVRVFRRRNIPLDNIVQDWFYWPEDKWGDHNFDPERFPDPDGMIQTLHDDLNTRLMISVWPKFYVGTENYDAFNERGWLYMRNIEMEAKDWVGPGYTSTFYDPYSKPARDLFWKQINEKLFSKGVDAWWLDATEPEPYSNVAEPERRLRINPTALGPASRYLNTYSLMNAKGIYEGQRETKPNQRVFILTRSAFAGQQRYAAATWSGDVAARWYDLKAQIPAGLNICLSGIPYWTSDIGGFSVESRFSRRRGITEEDQEEWREFMTRWFQFGAFSPLFRAHGEYPYREMFNVAPDDHPAYQTMLAYDKLRYRLMPYIYSLTGMVTHNDYTIMRALVMDFGKDADVLNIGDQYMFGPALLVNPVTDYQLRTRPVYLPAGTGWYGFRYGRYFEGGQTIEADAPYSDIPLFVREGSIIPFGPAIQYTTEKPADPIRLIVYTGKDGAFTLYEDEDINYNYERGAFSMIPFTYSEQDKSLTIGARTGEFPGMLEERTFEIVWVTKDIPARLNLDRSPAQTVRYDGNELVVEQN